MIAALSSLSVATPALANSAAANADVTAPLRAAQAAKPAVQGDEDFRSLFNGWKSMDNGQLVLAPATSAAVVVSAAPTYRPTTVSIPSRMPVEGAALTSGYGMRFHPVLGGRRAHKGVDLAQPTGTPIYATADGVISKAEWFSSYGLYIAMEHGGNIQTRYGHLSRLNVAAGQKVRKGDLIGYVGSTGRSTGPHLHYEVRIGGVAVNPVPYMQGASQPALAAAPANAGLAGQGDGDED
ncbi:M23 family metallopeptidase [Novosphingobium sp.]|uniref:M23 family metallopeptidase n=1 Tax=Novosphingobium sp. TaxID=1874826 RepID=UPI0025D51FD9|nr:M23 family metallopeptidase [Novosphingobium sp.]MCC6926568.1 M23 family metallopeptidase [Novosphingobium sp.]